MSYYTLLQRTHKQTVALPPAQTWPFEIGMNIQQPGSNSPQYVFSDLMSVSGKFGTFADPTRAGQVFPTLNATDRWPTEDFGKSLPLIRFSASAQVLHCKLLGLATITTTSVGWSITSVVVTGDDTTFDVTIAAGAAEVGGVLKFFNTQRTAISAVNTGCRGLIVRAPGIALADTDTLMPYMEDAFAPFSYLRWVYPQQILSNTYTRAPADRATATNLAFMPEVFYGGGYLQQTRSLEACIASTNELGKNGWFHIPIAANDALVTEMATVIRDNLDPAKWALIELGNENWNSIFLEMQWCISKAADEVNGFVWQYAETKQVSFLTKTAGTVTAEFTLPDGHGCAVGDIVNTQSFSEALGQPTIVNVSGNKTILTTPSATTCTWFEATGADYARSKLDDGVFRSGPLIVSATRLGTVMTIVFGKDHNMTAAVTQVKVVGITGLTTTLTTISTTPDARTITMPCTAGTDGAITLTGASSLYAFPSISVLNADNAADQHILARRWYARRTKEIGVIFASVFGGSFGTRVKIGLFNQPGNTQQDQLDWLNTTYGAPSAYLHVIGQGSYIFLDATPFGGSNLRNVDTFNGNTPVAKQDYADTWQLTAANAPSSVGSGGARNYDGTAMTARRYGLEMWEYEFGPDATTTTSGGNGGTNASRLQKIDTLHDPVFEIPYNTLLNSLETSGWQKVTVYNGAAVPFATANCFQSWGIFRDVYTTPETNVRWATIVARLAAPRTGPTRNLLSTTVPVTIDGRATLGILPPYSGAFPAAIASSLSPMNNWIISAPAAGDWTFEPTFNSSSGTRNIIVQVNNVNIVPNYSIPVGSTTFPPVTLTLTKGHNLIRTIVGTSNPGTIVTVLSYLFTPVP